jgi:hypothetical protein
MRKRKITAFDDYNSSPPNWEQKLIGAITTQFGNPAPRHGWKLVEIYET